MSEENIIGKLGEELTYIGVDLPPKNILEQCAEILGRFNLSVEEFCEEWITFSFQPDVIHAIKLNSETLASFERFLVKESERKQVKEKVTKTYVNSPKADPVLNIYSDSPVQKTNTPKRGRNDDDDDDDSSVKRPKGCLSSKKSLYNVKDGLLSTSLLAQEEEDMAAYCVNFTDRKDALEVVISFGIQNLRDKSTFQRKNLDDTIIIKQIHENEVFKHDCALYYDIKVRKLSSLNNKIEHIGKFLVEKHKLSKPEIFNSLPYLPETSTAYGRIMKNNKGKIDESTLLLETSASFGSGTTSHIDLYNVNKNLVLFSGQTVAVSAAQGRNTTIATSVFTDAMLDLPKNIPDIGTSGPMQFVVAAGPFTMSNLLYEPLKELIKYIYEHNPHVVILMGPFLDVSLENTVKEIFTLSYKSHFEGIISDLAEKLKEKMCDTQIVIVSSSKDLHHFNVYPTPPYHLEERYPNVHFMSDPSVIDINGVLIGTTSTDVLFHVNKEALFIKRKEQGTSRMNLLIKSILEQQCFYPLYPPVEDVCLDLNLLKKHAFWSQTPHIMILPSKLRYFVKEIDGCVVINPERLSTGCSGGTFARMEIYPNQTSQTVADNVVCEILKI